MTRNNFIEAKNNLATFRLRLKMYLVLKNLSQKQFGDLINVAPSTVNTWLTVSAIPSGDSIKKIAEATKISADWWLGVKIPKAEEVAE